MVIRFVFANPKQWWKQVGAELIRQAEGTSASHMSIELQTILTKRHFESVFPHTRWMTDKDWKQNWVEVKAYEFPVPTNRQWEVRQWLLSQLGLKYSLAQLFLILLCKINP